VGKRLHLTGDKTLITGRLREILDQRVADKASGFNLGLKLHWREFRLSLYPNPRTLSCSPSVRHRIYEITDRSVETLLDDRQRVEQTISTGAQLLDLRSSRLALAGEIAEHPFTNALRFTHHVAATGSSFFHTFVCLALRLADNFLTLLLPLGAERVGGRNRFESNGVGFAIGAFTSFGRGAMGCFKNLGGLYSECFGNAAGFESDLRHVLDGSLLLDQPALQFIAKTLETPDLCGSGTQGRLHCGGVEAATDQGEGGLLKSCWINPII
jgi:hypothetical protein